MDTRDELMKMLRDLEEDLAHRQKAINHLREAIRLMSRETPTKELSNESKAMAECSPKGVAQIIDDYIARLRPGDKFTARDVIQVVVAAGYEETDALRSNVSAALSRRVDKTIKRVSQGRLC